MKVRCNMCEAEFDESEITYDGESDTEFCPECGEGGCLMDLGDELREEFLESIDAEYTLFKETKLAGSKGDIFCDSLEIYFYSELHSFFNDTSLDSYWYAVLLDENEDIIGCLWRKFLKWDCPSIQSYSDIENFIGEYIGCLPE